MTSQATPHNFLDPPAAGDTQGEHLGTLGHYRVIRELGKGGMGYVFLAQDTRLKREVALKVMNQKIAVTQGSRKRFISEARAMASVHHDNVATIFEVGEHKGTPFMSMELLEGNTLESFNQRTERPSYQEIIRYASDIARGLAAAHAQGIVHRDIKPANIWLDTKSDRIKILDFGLALAQTPVDQLSGRGAVVGTPGYLSPEQARSEPLDDRSDLYSTGVVLYEMATGALPLKSKTVAEQLIAILVHAPKPIRERNSDIPTPLADLIHRLMAKEPRDRVDSAAVLEKELEKAAVDCESKSEVAQAINQLQLGLDQAVKKKEVPEADPFAASSQAMPNPFESLPDVMAATPVATAATEFPNGSGSFPSGSGSFPSGSGSFPAVTIGASATQVASGSKAKSATSANTSPDSDGVSSKVIWIGVGVVALLLIGLIPAIVYWSTTSAIARQNKESAVTLGDLKTNQPSSAVVAEPNTTLSESPSRDSSPASKIVISENSATAKNLPANQSVESSELKVTTVSASRVEGMGEKNSVRWVLDGKQFNGSFEETQPKKNAKRVPGWKFDSRGGDAGWKVASLRRGKTNTHPFAGKKSRLRLTSDTLKYQAAVGDRIRVGLSVGGSENGKSDYQVILGFENSFGEPLRLELAKFTDGSKWRNQNPTQYVYEYETDQATAGKRPFVELIVSNEQSQRSMGMLDRVSVTVKENQASNSEMTALAPAEQTQSEMPGEKNDLAMAQPTPEESEGPIESAEPETTQRVTLSRVNLTTADEFGADATVKRGTSSKNTLGKKPQLVVQTRNGHEIQHIYLRFPISDHRSEKPAKNSGRGNRGQNGVARNDGGKRDANAKPDFAAAALQLTIAMSEIPDGGTLRLYGLDDAVSDVWPENKIVWGNSLSESGLESLPLLAELTISGEKRLVNITSPELASFLSEAQHRTVTLILTGGFENEPITFAAKEDSDNSPPTLILGIAP